MSRTYTPSELVAARMKELVDLRTSWHRSLWQVSTVIGLREIIEAAESTWSGQVPTDGALRDFISSIVPQVRRDHGLGVPAVRDRICALIEKLPAKPTDAARSALMHLTELIERGADSYLDRWADYVGSDQLHLDEVEICARLVVAHLLDVGLHRSHLHGWLTNVPKSQAVPDTIRHGGEMISHGLQSYTLMLAANGVSADVAAALGDVAVEAAAYTAAFADTTNASGFAQPRLASIGLRLSFPARDPHSAVAAATSWAQRFTSRVAIGRGDAVRVDELVVDLRSNKVRSAAAERRPIRLPSIQRGELYATIDDDGSNASIDDAIALLAVQDQTDTGPSIASTWAAVEGLLGQAGGKGVDAADRLADIVACGFPRAELTELARRWEKHGTGALARDLRRLSSNSSKVAAMLQQLTTLGDPGFTSSPDVAAVYRSLQLANQPAVVLERVRSYNKSMFRRLYYQRNFIMHAARFDSVSLPATSRLASQLVAAGIDRIVNARFGDSKTSALGLAARARNELELLNTPAAKPVWALLDT